MKHLTRIGQAGAASWRANVLPAKRTRPHVRARSSSWSRSRASLPTIILRRPARRRPMSASFPTRDRAPLRFWDRSPKKSLTKLCLYEIMMAGFDSELARGGAKCGMRSAGGTPRAYRRPPRRTGPAGGTPAVQRTQTNRDQVGFFSPALHLFLQVTVCQRRMFLRINALHGKKMRRAVIPLARNR